MIGWEEEEEEETTILSMSLWIGAKLKAVNNQFTHYMFNTH